MKVFIGGSAMWREWSDGLSKRVFVGECAGSRLVDRPRKRWIKGCLRKRGLDVR